jgi:hypothetical protein
MKTNIYVCALLLVLGMLGHFALRLYNLQQAGTLLSPMAYARQQPYAVAVALMGGILLFLALYFFGQLNEGMSIFVGIGCGEALETLRARAVAKLRDNVVQPSSP